jgi:cytochrome c oxidase cbb3-type subunit 3
MRIRATSMLVLAALTVACERETRRYQEIPAAATRHDSVPLTSLQPGAPRPENPALSPYQENAYGMAEGKRLFAAYNCNGCHASGGGGIGPALMDDKWIYGFDPYQIHSTIVQGRPNGMPAYGGRIPNQQVWQLVAYVQSMSGLVPKDAAPGRNDSMAVVKPEMRKEREQPRQTGHR